MEPIESSRDESVAPESLVLDVLFEPLQGPEQRRGMARIFDDLVSLLERHGLVSRDTHEAVAWRSHRDSFSSFGLGDALPGRILQGLGDQRFNRLHLLGYGNELKLEDQDWWYPDEFSLSLRIDGPERCGTYQVLVDSLIAYIGGLFASLGGICGYLTQDVADRIQSPYEKAWGQNRPKDGDWLRHHTRGYYWGNWISRGHITQLGGADTVLNEAPCAERVQLSDDAIYLQLTDEIVDTPRSSLMMLSEYLDPLLDRTDTPERVMMLTDRDRPHRIIGPDTEGWRYMGASGWWYTADYAQPISVCLEQLHQTALDQEEFDPGHITVEEARVLQADIENMLGPGAAAQLDAVIERLAANGRVTSPNDARLLAIPYMGTASILDIDRVVDDPNVDMVRDGYAVGLDDAAVIELFGTTQPLAETVKQALPDIDSRRYVPRGNAVYIVGFTDRGEPNLVGFVGYSGD